jgi:hypothetical protein
MGGSAGPLIHPQVGGFKWLLEHPLNGVVPMGSVASPVGMKAQVDATAVFPNGQDFQPSANDCLVALDVDH